MFVNEIKCIKNRKGYTKNQIYTAGFVNSRYNIPNLFILGVCTSIKIIANTAITVAIDY